MYAIRSYYVDFVVAGAPIGGGHHEHRHEEPAPFLLGRRAMEVRGKRIWGGRPCTDEQAETILNAVLDAGINFIATSNSYNFV